MRRLTVITGVGKNRVTKYVNIPDYNDFIVNCCIDATSNDSGIPPIPATQDIVDESGNQIVDDQNNDIHEG